MGRRTRAFLDWLRREHRPQGQKAGEVLEGPREPGSLLPDQDPLCTVLRGHGRRIVRADVSRDFELRHADVLGTGCSGSVVLAEHRQTRQQVAVKTFAKSKLKPHQLERLRLEVSVGLEVDHPNVCKLLHVYEKGDKVWLVMELCSGDLFDRVKKDGAFSEKDAREAVEQMLRAVAYMHNHGMVHRDIKLENWMFGSGDGTERLKMIDFGFATRVESLDETMSVPCGTLHYVSPEVLKQRYSARTDMWSVGIVAYILLTGRMPFSGPKDSKIVQDIQHGSFRKEGRWCNVPAVAQDFVRKLLVKDPDARLTPEQALAHPWISGGAGKIREGVLPESDEDRVAECLWQFGQGSCLRRAALRVLAVSLPSSKLGDVERLFVELDSEHCGHLRAERLEELLRQARPDATAEDLAAALACLAPTGEEISYTSFVAAILTVRTDELDVEVRALFRALDSQGTGFLTARSLRTAFAGNPADTPPADTVGSELWLADGLSDEQAEEWIAEVDYKGNGTVDVEGFVLALSGEPCLPPALRGDAPDVKVFEESEDPDVVLPCGVPSMGLASNASTREGSVISRDDSFDHWPVSSWSKHDLLVGSPLILDSYFPVEFQIVGLH